MKLSELSPSTLFGSDETKPAVRMVFGISGQGKTMFLRESLRKAARSPDFGPTHRFVVFDVKHEGYETLAPPVLTSERAIRNLKRDRLAVIHPDIETARHELDDIIAWLFDAAEVNDEFSATLVIEESSTFIGSSVGSIPASVKRLATQGRSLNLTMILVNQRALSNKWTDTQASSITMFRLARPDGRMLYDRWGVDADSMDSRLKEKKFSFAHLDLESPDELVFYSPIEVPKNPQPVVVKKRARGITSLFRRPF